MKNEGEGRIHEVALVILPSLAMRWGVPAAILLQAVHEAADGPDGHLIEGRRWIRRSVIEWGDLMPFVSLSTIRRILTDFCEMGVLLSTSRYNRHVVDTTKWYAVDHDRLSEVLEATPPTRRWRAEVSKDVRLAVYERDGWACAYCGVPLTRPGERIPVEGGDWTDPPGHAGPTIDHRVPRSRGGGHEMDNLAACCAACNSNKGAKTPQEWMSHDLL